MILILAASTLANTFSCPFTDGDIQSQLEDCQYKILKAECEQNGIKVWSKSKTENNTLKADVINTESSCENLDIKYEGYRVKSGNLVVSYSTAISQNDVHVVTMEQWNDIKVGASKFTGTVTKLQRVDSTKAVDVSMRLRIDSQRLKMMKDRAKYIFAQLLSEEK